MRNWAHIAVLKPEFMKELIYPLTVGANNYSDQSLWLEESPDVNKELCSIGWVFGSGCLAG